MNRSWVVAALVDAHHHAHFFIRHPEGTSQVWLEGESVEATADEVHEAMREIREIERRTP